MAEFEVLGSEKKDSGEKKKGGKGIKNLLKKKPFVIAVIVVAFLGIYSLLKKSKQQTVEETGQNMVISDGLQGVSVLSNPLDSGVGGSSSFDSIYDMFYTEIENLETAHKTEIGNLTESYQNQISEMERSFESGVDEMTSQINTLSDRVNKQEYIIETQSSAIELQNDLAEMQRNSDSWHYATSDEQKKALENANKQIASKWGLTFNSTSGTWHDSTGALVYQTPTQQNANKVNTTTIIEQKKASSGGSGSSGSVSYVNDSNKYINQNKDSNGRYNFGVNNSGSSGSSGVVINRHGTVYKGVVS